jgi:Tfp pilus assembly protein PilN
MINLLPPENKERLLQEEKWRMILILQIIFLSFLICLVLILGLVSIYISGRAKVQKIILAEEEKRFEGSEAQEFQEKIIFFGKELGRVNNFYENQPNLVEQFENISKTLPSGVYLTTLSLTSQKEIPFAKRNTCTKRKKRISLSGYSFRFLSRSRNSFSVQKKSRSRREFPGNLFAPGKLGKAYQHSI